MEIQNQQVFQKDIKEGIVKKPVRSKAGVTVLTVVLKPRKCNHGTCVYCPGGETTPQSYTDKSPAIMRAMAFNYDIEKQVSARLEALKKMNHPTDKIEVIILGGTFLQYETEYQEYVIKSTYDVLNGDKSNTLELAKKFNEKSEHRVVALCIENRPDNCSEEDINRMLSYGCTRVELGVQILDDEIYKKINRGHTVKDVVDATQRLKDAGFKIGYHIMPGLPFSNPKKDLNLFKKVFSDERFKPDQIKIYPCQIVEGSPLSVIYRKGRMDYETYSEDVLQNLVEKMLIEVPEYCRVMRIMREIPSDLIVNPSNTNLRKEISDDLKERGIKLREIRSREIGFQDFDFAKVSHPPTLNVVKYGASGGKEFFIQVVDKNNILYGLLRLRLTKNKAIVRELHVYGQALEISKLRKVSHPAHPNGGEADSRDLIAQHTGLGKKLMAEAEKIAKKNKYKKIAVISGVGVREYYRKIGYKKEGDYMVKELWEVF